MILSMNYRDKQWLISQYITKSKTIREIADICGVTHVCILNWLKKHSITRRKTWTKNPVNLGANGYLVISLGKSKPGGMFYHRYLMEKYLGRPLRLDEIVHHKDGNKLNNSLENLEIITHKKHNHVHQSWKNIKNFRRGETHYLYKNIDIEKVVELYNDGLSAQRIASMFGCSKTLILRRLNKVSKSKTHT